MSFPRSFLVHARKAHGSRPSPRPDPAPVSDLRAARLHQFVLAGRALGRRAPVLRRLPPRLGRGGRAVGVLGRAHRGRAGLVRAADQRGAGRDRGDDVRFRRRQRAGERTAVRRTLEDRAVGEGSSRPSARSGTRRSRAALASSTRTRTTSTAWSTTTRPSCRSRTSRSGRARCTTRRKWRTWRTSTAR